MTTLENKNTFNSTTLFRFGILLYWSLFWLINSLDKMIGGSQFLWVGKDRFAQFQRFFASASWENPIITNIALIFVSALEIFAFLFFKLVNIDAGQVTVINSSQLQTYKIRQIF